MHRYTRLEEAIFEGQRWSMTMGQTCAIEFRSQGNDTGWYIAASDQELEPGSEIDVMISALGVSFPMTDHGAAVVADMERHSARPQ